MWPFQSISLISLNWTQYVGVFSQCHLEHRLFILLEAMFVLSSPVIWTIRVNAVWHGMIWPHALSCALRHAANMLSALPLSCLDVLVSVSLAPDSQQMNGANMDCVHNLLMYMERKLQQVKREWRKEISEGGNQTIETEKRIGYNVSYFLDMLRLNH